MKTKLDWRDAAIAAIAIIAITILGTATLVQRDARAQTSPGTGNPLLPLGYCQLTSIDSATKISTCTNFPVNATVAILTPETQAIRYRDDGTNPSATVGQPIAALATVAYSGTMSALTVISQVAGAKLNISFYR